MGGKDGKKKKKPLHEYNDAGITTRLYTHIGVNSMQLHSLHALDDNVLLSFAANTVQFINVSTGNITCQPGPEGGGIGAVCVHPSRQFYTVCEKHPNGPNAIVYEYPSKKARSTLRRGAEKGYSACRFSDNGDLLATVAIEPDFVLTIWSWEAEAIVLRNKAFGADVYNVAFNRFNPGLIVSSGSGHIKFWSMANTFTGLKLQGHIGKFGRTEISDVSAFISMPDGKVISGSESGALLLWEGNLIKCELGKAQPDNEEVPVARCHDGYVHVVELVEQNRLVLTAGDDGYFRYWLLEEIDQAENSGTDAATPIRMLLEVSAGEGVKVRCITRSTDGQYWFVLDSAGAIRKVNYMSYDAVMHAANNPGTFENKNDRQPLLRFHSGGITALAPSPFDHTALTGGQDCTIRLMDYVTRSEEFCVRFDAPIADMRYLEFPNDSEQRHILATFADGTVRILLRGRNTVGIVSQSRPHESPIVAWAIDPAGTQLWTLAKDKSAFYFKVTPKRELVPVGFCELPEVPRCAEFTSTGDRLFVGFKSGCIITLAPPDESKIDHSVGFSFDAEWEGIGYRQKMKPPPKEVRLNADGTEMADDEESDEDLLAEEEDTGPWPVNFIKRLPHGTVLVGLAKPELCYEYNLSTRYPDKAMGPPPLPSTGIEPNGWVEEPMRNLAYRDTIITGATVSRSQGTLVLRTEHSTVLLRGCKRLEQGSFATQLHDSHSQLIAQADMSFDERVLLTCGLDGMLFAHEIEGIEPPSSVDVASPEALPVMSLPTVAPIPNSVQHQKELDDRRAAEEAALGKKEQLMRKVRSVHVEYDKLLDENEAAAGGKKVDSADIVLDPEVLALLEDKKVAAVAEARKEYEWQSAKKATLLKKLQAAFVDPLEFERFEVHGFDNGLTVSAFRTPHLTADQLAVLEKVRQIHQGAASPAGSPQGRALTNTDNGSTGGHSPLQPGDMSLPAAEGEAHQDPEDGTAGVDVNASRKEGKIGATSSSVKSQLEKAEERKRERIARRKGMQELLNRNPRLQPDNIEEQAAIERAADEMGDYRLKTSKDYARRPDQQAPTAQRKVAQLIVLEEGINTLRREFNHRVLALRDQKALLCESINADKQRIKRICDRLKVPYDDTPLALSLVEQPEKRFDIDNAGLEAFAEEQERERKKREAAERAKKGFGADLATMEDDEPAAAAEKRRQSVTGAAAAGLGAAGAPLGPREKFEMDLKARLEAVRNSELEEEEWLMLRTQLEYERSRLERHIGKTIEAFDESLASLYHEKLKLEADLCMADMRVKLLFREYLLLLDFKQRDKELADRRDMKAKELEEIEKKRQRVEEQRHAKQAEMAEVEIATEELKHEFEALVAEMPKGAFAELEAIYTKKIKRRKPEDDEDDDDDSSSSDDDEDEDEEEWGEEGDDTCPTGVDEELFEAVLAVREKRLDQVDRRNDLTKAMEQLRKDSDNLRHRLEDAKKHLAKVEKEEDAFQREKQERLNQLETMVVLKLSQMRCLSEQRKMPRELTDEYVVFTQGGLQQLQDRIVGLGVEREELEAAARQLDQEMSKLSRKRAKRFAEYQEWDAKVYEVQLLKFGQRVNLEMLENVAVDRETEELKAQLKAEEIRWERELAKQGERLQTMKLTQQQRIAENTACLKDLGSYRAEQRDLEEALKTSAGKIVAKMTGGSKVATAADRAHLKDLVVAQQQEIDALKNEIAMLRRKGGHVYTPVVNKVAPPASQA
eukprot:CAMPEP_0174829322 /NCGR_PEP_ID=MMETSP1114-20130205/1869_1 /TAXON_ID=312471 /ORGANISM="Neobodo designis, Strain CCAP 1951/1" /LENGTH=1723 /DNA_ID=CAMNT_0016063065 /DNA_START=117 /DNA_END=5288 /DNA_ORIENTATION=+